MDSLNQPLGIRAVIFDMDGVLTDSEPLINAAAIAMFKEKGLNVQPADFLPFVGTGEDRYIGGVAEKYEFALDLSAAKKRTYEIYLELVPARLDVFPGACDLVKSCQSAGLRVAVASSADRIKVAANLEKIGLPISTWDAVVTGEDVSVKKPAPDIFLNAARRLGVSPPESVVVEDAVNGVQAAKAAGMRCVAVAQTFPAERLQAADRVRQRIAEVTLEDLLDRPMPTPVAATPSTIPAAAGEAPGASNVRGPWGLWATLGLAAAVGVAFVAMQAVVALGWALAAAILHHGVLPKGWESNGLLLSVATCCSAPVSFGFTWLFAHLRKGMPVGEYLGFRRVSIKATVSWTLALLGLVAASDLLTVQLGKPLVPEFMQSAYRTAHFVPLLWVALLIAAPLTEETLFRGFLFTGILHSKLGATGAVTLTSLIWALIHLQYDAYGVATVVATGLLLGLARLFTGSLYLTMFLHFLMNFIASVETVCVLRTASF